MLKKFPLSKVYQLLEPGPVVLLTTAQKGRANVITMSWHMMVEFEPPLTRLYLDNKINDNTLLRFRTEGQLSEESDGLEYNQSITTYTQVNQEWGYTPSVPD